jgi:glycosyltransferase involved in cell wall biosynthesis
MPDPLVSVVVPVYNGERFLAETLESVFAQDFDAFEVIVVDDGSTDSTADIARSFPVRYTYQENRGPSAARNAALGLARGELIAFVDADDLLPPDKLRTQACYLAKHPETACVLGRQEWILEDGIEPGALQRDRLYGVLGGIQLVSAMIRRNVLEPLGGFDPSYRYAEDRDLFVRMREHGLKIDVLPDVVLYKRLHGANATMNPPARHPLTRSLKAKLDRERARGVQ